MKITEGLCSLQDHKLNLSQPFQGVRIICYTKFRSDNKYFKVFCHIRGICLTTRRHALWGDQSTAVLCSTFLCFKHKDFDRRLPKKVIVFLKEKLIEHQIPSFKPDCIIQGGKNTSVLFKPLKVLFSDLWLVSVIKYSIFCNDLQSYLLK